jgi:biopolymer transport protein ExbB
MNKLFAFFLMLAVIGIDLVHGSKVSLAQEKDKAAAPADAKAAPAEGAKDAAKEGEAGGEHKGQSGVMWVIETSGYIGLLILVLSFFLIATVVRMFMELRPQVVEPPEVVAQCTVLIEQRDFRALYTFVQADESLFSKALASGLTEIPHGLHEAREAMDRVAEVETSLMEKKVAILGMLGTLGPMIGLLGTLSGMIKSFGKIATGGTTLKAEEVAGGISEALLLTFEGVGLAILAIIFFTVFKSRIANLTSNALLQADKMLRQVSQAIKTKAPAQPRPQPAVQ